MKAVLLILLVGLVSLQTTGKPNCKYPKYPKWRYDQLSGISAQDTNLSIKDFLKLDTLSIDYMHNDTLLKKYQLMSYTCFIANKTGTSKITVKSNKFSPVKGQLREEFGECFIMFTDLRVKYDGQRIAYLENISYLIKSQLK